MDKIRARGFVNHGNNLMLFRAPGGALSYNQPGVGPASPLTQEDREECLKRLTNLAQDCEAMGLRMTLVAVQRLIDSLKNRPKPVTFLELRNECDAVQRRLCDELDLRLFLHVDARFAPYYEQPNRGWETVINAFPSATVDIEEASKCFALNRFTAVVFHLMRTMEVGLRVLARTLNDPNLDPKTNPNWERILKKCRDEQAKPLAQRSPDWQADEPFFSNAAARLAAVKDAWRNPTMHVEVIYTEETSLDVLNHVQAFMRHLATKLSENP